MDPRDIIRQQFLEVVDNQLEANDPPETAQTLQRLKSEGYSDEDARMLIAQCVAAEMYEVFNSNAPFDQERYLKMLHALPTSPE